MKTNHANAKHTKRIRCRISGTSTAARRLLNIRIVEGGAGGNQRVPRALRKEYVAGTQSGRQRHSGASAQNLNAVEQRLDQAAIAQRVGVDLDRRVPGRQATEIHDGQPRAEMAAVARLLRVTATVRKAPRPGGLAAFEGRTLAAAGTHGLPLAAFTAGLDHTRTVTAADALTLGPAAGHGLERAELENRLICHRYATYISLTVLPRIAATCSAVRSDFNAETVAITTLIGLFVPRHLVRMSWMPASSSTARMEPPAITPVPGAAGLSSTVAAPTSCRTSCGIVFSTMATVMRLLRACSTALRIASGTSPALPIA